MAELAAAPAGTTTTLVFKCARPGCGGDVVFRLPDDGAATTRRCRRCRAWHVLDVRLSPLETP